MTYAVNVNVGDLTIRANLSAKSNDGVLETVSSMWSQSKNVADAVGVVKNSCVLLAKAMPETATATFSHLEKIFGDARNVMSTTYLLTVVNNFLKARTVRNGVEVIKIGSFASAAVSHNKAFSAISAKVGGLFGVALDSIDLVNEFEMHSACANLAAEDLGRPEVHKIVDNQLLTSACKIFKLVLTLFAGIVATGAWAFGLVIPTFVATAAVVASLGALGLSFAMGYSDHVSEWTAKVSLNPAANNV
jgi:hypothetical protein